MKEWEKLPVHGKREQEWKETKPGGRLDKVGVGGWLCFHLEPWAESR